jgi:hypothetical protein
VGLSTYRPKYGNSLGFYIVPLDGLGGAIDHWTMGFNMNRLLTVAILATSITPLFAQAQQPDVADAQKAVSIISGDEAKIQTFCQMLILGKQIDEAIEEKDTKKAEELAQRVSEREKQLGPEYLAPVDAVRNLDFTSKDGQQILSIFDRFDDSCTH